MSDDRNNLVGRFEIYVQDMRPAKAFYESVVGTQFVQQTGYGATGALGFDSGAKRVLVFGCADRAVEAAKAENAAGASPKYPSGHMAHIALVFGTEGNMIGLHSMR